MGLDVAHANQTANRIITVEDLIPLCREIRESTPWEIHVFEHFLLKLNNDRLIETFFDATTKGNGGLSFGSPNSDPFIRIWDDHDDGTTIVDGWVDLSAVDLDKDGIPEIIST